MTLNSVANHFHYHPKYLSSLIRKYTSRSFSDILKDIKLQEICYYLKYTDMTIDEILEKTGYADRSYFNRMFKKMPPDDTCTVSEEISAVNRQKISVFHDRQNRHLERFRHVLSACIFLSFLLSSRPRFQQLPLSHQSGISPL